MGSRQETVDFILEQITGTGATAKKMFGEYALYCNEKVVALICDDQLFIKITNEAKDFLWQWNEAPPYKNARPCFLISEEKWEDSEWLSSLIRITAEQLPTVKKKK